MVKAENIANREFRRVLYGYDREEVDLYLDEIVLQLRQMEQERKEMVATIEYLVSELTGANKPEHLRESALSEQKPHEA